MGSYSVYEKNGSYFTYKKLCREEPVLARFGLISTKDTRWSDLRAKIDKLNNNTEGDVYKVIFFGRHALSTNSNITEWDEGISSVWPQDVPLVDSPLTQIGYLQACNVLSIWQAENSIGKENNINSPDISYCSPMMRALVTNSITFSPQLSAKTITTVIREDCRERIYPRGQDTEHRRSKACIQDMFPRFKFEDNFADDDPYWGTEESSDELSKRANHILDSIFDTGNKDKNFVSITSHGEIIDAIFKIIGFSHSIHHGGVIALICVFKPPVSDDDDDDE